MIDHSLSKAKVCKIVDLSRPVLYRPRVDRMERDREVIAALNLILEQRSRARGSFRKCYDRFRLDGYSFNNEHLHSVCHELKLNS